MEKFLTCVLFFVLTFETVLSETFFGKLVLKTPSTERRHSVFEKNPVVFATRRSTYLKKNGDVFKIHIPAISQGASSNTVSFESMRIHNFFLTKDQVDDNFRITRRNGTDPKSDDSATFIIERRAGIEGSGMLRVSSAPSKYLCVRRGTNVVDSALQAIEKEATEDFKYRCSFYIQKLKEENVDAAIKKSMDGNETKLVASAAQKPHDSTNAAISNLLQEFNKKLEHHQQALLSEAAEQENHKGIETSQKAIRTYNNGITKTNIEQKPVKKAKVEIKSSHPIQNIKKANKTKYSDNKNEKKKETPSKPSAFVKSSTMGGNQYQNIYQQNYQQQPSMMFNMYNPYINPYNQYINNVMVSQTSSYAQNKMLAAVASNDKKASTKLSKGTNAKKVALQTNDHKMIQTPRVSLKAPVKPLSNVDLNMIETTSKLQRKNPVNSFPNIYQNRDAKYASNATSLKKAHKKINSSKVIGPKNPINVHDFQMTHMHREPSLNIDGLMHSVTLPATRSDITNPKYISNSTTSNDGSLPGHATNNSSDRNIFFNTNELNDSRIEQTSSEHKGVMVVHKVSDVEDKANLTSETVPANATSKLDNTTSFENTTTSRVQDPMPESSMVVNATKYRKNNSTSLNDTISTVTDEKVNNVSQNKTVFENSTINSVSNLNSNATLLNATSSLINTTITAPMDNSSLIFNSSFVNNTVGSINSTLSTATMNSTFVENSTDKASTRNKIQGSKENLTNVINDANANDVNVTTSDNTQLRNITGQPILNASFTADPKNKSSVLKNTTDSGERKTINSLTGNSNKKNATSSLLNSTNSEMPVKNQTVGINPNDEPKLMINPLVNASNAEEDAAKTTEPDETVGGNPNELPTQKIPFHQESGPMEGDVSKTSKPDETVGSNPNNLPNQKIPFRLGEEREPMGEDVLPNADHLPLNKISLLHRTVPQEQGTVQIARNNATVSLGSANDDLNAVDEAEPGSLSYTTQSQAGSLEEQNAMAMQGISGAVQKINQKDVQDFTKRIHALDLEDKNPNSNKLLTESLRNSNNPSLRNLLMGNVLSNKTNNTDVDEDYSSDSNSYVLNGDTKSRLPNHQLPELRREHHVLGLQRDHVNIHDDFHHHDLQLSQDDRERYNELNHALISNDQHHYLNDDSMHPPTSQNIEEVNTLHHEHHGVIDDDAMSPPNHPHDYYHEFVHHGDFDISGHPAAEHATHHVFTEHNAEVNNNHPIVGSPNGHPTTLYENDHYEPARTSDGTDDQYIGHSTHMTDETNLQHHTHHVVTVKSEAEKQKMVHGLVDPTKDKCISLQIVNDIGRRYRLISSINKHGYTPRGKLFTLKTVFKDPNVHKLVLFKAVDELDPANELDIDGKNKYVAFPTSCQSEAKLVHVVRPHQQPSVIGCGSSNSADCTMKKSSINSIRMKLKASPTLKQTNNFKRSDVEMPPSQSGCVRAYHGKNPLVHSCCVFPFVFGGVQHNGCIKSGEKAWCGTTGNVDRDKKWGLCTPPNSIPEFNSISHHASPIICQPYCKIRCLPICPNSCC